MPLILLNIIKNTPYYFFYSSLTNEIAAGVDEEFVLSNEIANITSKIEFLTKKISQVLLLEKNILFLVLKETFGKKTGNIHCRKSVFGYRKKNTYKIEQAVYATVS
jgi:hypothetical protein